ncbi:MAG TPA: hypothetical protein VGB59_10020 [Allosphingosinicella sp.]|jgi:hypothetical protein
MTDETHEVTDQTTAENQSLERRRAVLKLGLYAAYTAPLLMGMATAAQAQTCDSQGICTIPGTA